MKDTGIRKIRNMGPVYSLAVMGVFEKDCGLTTKL